MEIDEYMRGPYLDLKSEVEQLDSLISEVLPVFKDSYLEGGWPYEIEAGTPLEKQKNFSFSTNCMILFTMAFSMGCLESSSLLPNAARRCQLLRDAYHPDISKGKSFEDTFNRAFKEVVEKSPENERGWDHDRPVIQSTSFGEDDPLTLSWLIEILANADSTMPSSRKKLVDPKIGNLDKFKSKVAHRSYVMAKRAFAEPEKALFYEEGKNRWHMRPAGHAFPLLRAVHLYEGLKSMDTGKAAELESDLIEKVRPRFFSFVHQHLSFNDITNSPFDAAELVFSLEGLLLIDRKSMSIDKHLLERVFQVIRDRQRISSYWRPLKPFVNTPQGLVLLPLSVEIANSLLRICDLLDFGNKNTYFSANLELFQKYSSWLGTRVRRGKTGATSLSPESSEVIPPFEFVGWHSEHVHVSQMIHPWETSQVMLFLMHYRPMLQDHIARTLIQETNLSTKRLRHGKHLTPTQYWTEYCEGKEPLKGSAQTNSQYLVLQQIRDHFVAPRESGFLTTSRRPPSYSMLLYGPPGTMKTTIAEEIAKSLEWPLIIITPSDFIARGEAEVEARAKVIFQALCEQTDKVILLDEIDQFMLDRDSRWYRHQSDILKFITPGMLPMLRELRRQKRTIFIVATNYQERIDAAIKRPGRIDHKFLVSLPGKEQRLRILRDQIKEKLEEWDSVLDAQLTDESLDPVANSTVLFSFGELVELIASAVENFVGSGRKDIGTLLLAIKKDAESHDGAAERLLRYRSRFNMRRRGDQEPEPFEEFLLLVHLICEARDLTKHEQDFVKDVINKKRGDKDIDKILKATIPDTFIQKQLLSRISNIMGGR